jgi:hypothetical protein
MDSALYQLVTDYSTTAETIRARSITIVPFAKSTIVLSNTTSSSSNNNFNNNNNNNIFYNSYGSTASGSGGGGGDDLAVDEEEAALSKTTTSLLQLLSQGTIANTVAMVLLQLQVVVLTESSAEAFVKIAQYYLSSISTADIPDVLTEGVCMFVCLFVCLFLLFLLCRFSFSPCNIVLSRALTFSLLCSGRCQYDHDEVSLCDGQRPTRCSTVAVIGPASGRKKL